MSHSIDARFECGEILARGAFGEVTRGTDRATGRAVAIKRGIAGASDPHARERLVLEGRLLASIDDPHVVRCVAQGEDADGTPYLVLEWLEGADLARVLRRATLDVPDAVEIARQAARGLAAIHAVGAVHRDVKPSNLIVAGLGPASSSLHTTLIDLGVARHASEVAMTAAGVRIGTPAYMSPEQARGDVVGPASDVFALGAVLYELLAGCRAFVGTDPFAVLARIVLQSPPPLERVAPHVPAPLVALVRRAMQRDPRARFGSAAEFAAALGALDLAHEPDRTERIEPPDRAAVDAPTSRVSASSLGARGERRVVTVLFAGLPDADDDALAELERRVVAARGRATRIVGARAIATFGLERSEGDEAVRAARVALALVARTPGAQIALATRAVSDRGDALPSELLDHGAAFLADAPRGVVCVDTVTARLLDGHVALAPRDAHGVVFALRPPDTDASGDRRLFGLRTSTVGREREIALLERARADSVECASPRVVLVTAPPGMGKSRIAHEWLARLASASPDAVVLTAPCDPLAEDSPLGTLSRLVVRACGLRADEAPAAQRARIEARVACVAPDARARVTGFLGELVGVRDGDAAPSAQVREARRDPVVMGDQLRRAWEDWLAAECARAPGVVLLLEDVHWADAPSMRFIDSTLRNLEDRALLVVATARPEVHARFPALWRERGLQEVTLAALPRAACERLAREVLGPHAAAETLSRLCARAAGNAFFLEELIRAVAEGQREDALPATVLALVQARLDALEPAARGALRAASVFGEVFWRGGVAALLGADAGTAIETLVEREIAQPRPGARFGGEAEYALRHALVRDAAYASVDEPERTAWHAAAGAWLEAAGEHDPVVLAQHFERGGAPARAAEHLARGAAQALDANDFANARALAARGLATMLAAGLASDQGAGELRLLEAVALRWLGEPIAGARGAKEAMALLAHGSPRWLDAVAEHATGAQTLGQTDDVVAAADAVEHLARELGPRRADARLLVTVAQLASQLFFRGCVEQGDRLVALARAGAEARDPDPVLAARIAYAAASRALQAEQWEAALAASRVASDAFERVGSLRDACLQWGNQGYLLMEFGAYEAAESRLRESSAVGRRLGAPLIEAYAKHNLGLVCALRGAVAEGLAVERDAIALFEPMGVPTHLVGGYIYLARIALMAGDLDACEHAARDAAAGSVGLAQLRANALAVLARLLVRRGRADEALAASAEAMEAMEASPGAPLVPAVVVPRLEALLACGLRDEARALAQRAGDALRRRAAGMADASLRDSFLQAVPDNARLFALEAEVGRAPASPAD